MKESGKETLSREAGGERDEKLFFRWLCLNYVSTLMYLSCLYKIYTFPVFTPLSQCLVVGTSHQTMGPSFPRVTLRSIQAQLTAPGWLLWLLDLASNSTSPSFKFMGHTTSLLSGKKWQRNRLQICRNSFNETMRTVCYFESYFEESSIKLHHRLKNSQELVIRLS